MEYDYANFLAVALTVAFLVGLFIRAVSRVMTQVYQNRRGVVS